MLQRLEENRHKESPRRLVGHGPSDDKNAFRTEPDWTLEPAVQAQWRLRVLDWLESWAPMVIDWPKSWTTRRSCWTPSHLLPPAAAASTYV